MAIVSDYTSLISGNSWNGMNTGLPVFITYSLLETSQLPSLSEYQPYTNNGYTTFNAQQRGSFYLALSEFEKVSGIKFIEVYDPANASIKVMNTSGSDWGGWANYGIAEDWHSSNGYLVVDNSSSTYLPGTYAFETILHELGHATGLKHPFSGDPTLVSSMDNEDYTLMSYTGNGVYDTALASLDIHALTYLYGNSSAIDSSWSWNWSDATDSFSLNGAGGNDILIAVDANSSVSGMDGDDIIFGRDGDDNLYGGEGNDILGGGSGYNELYGEGGDDRFLIASWNGNNTTYYGGIGTDTLDYSFLTWDQWISLDYSYIIDIENLIGSSSDDHLSGNFQANWLEGMKGSDTLFGYFDNDALDGGDYVDLTSLQGQVYRLYQATLDRAPDEGGFAGWVNSLESGNSLAAITTGFIASSEFQAAYGSLDNSAFVSLLYNNVLDRAPDSGGLASWVAQLNGGATRESVVNGFSESLEFINNTDFAAAAYGQKILYDDMLGQVYRLYQATLDRAPDEGGFASWVNSLESGNSLAAITTGFIGSTEFQDVYGSLDNSAFVTLLYNNVLDRAPDSGGLASWVNALNGGATRESVVNGFSESLEFINNTTADLETYIRNLSIWENRLDGGIGDDNLLGGRGGDIFVFDADEDGTDTVFGLQDWDTLLFENFSYANAATALSNFSQTGDDVTFSDQGVDIIFTNTTLAGFDADMFTFA